MNNRENFLSKLKLKTLKKTEEKKVQFDQEEEKHNKTL